MGMYDDVEIAENAEFVPEDYRHELYQSKSLDCDGSLYRVDSAGQLLKVIQKSGHAEQLFYSKNISQDIECHGGSLGGPVFAMVMQVRCGIVQGVVVNSSDDSYWDGQRAVWEEFISVSA